MCLKEEQSSDTQCEDTTVKPTISQHAFVQKKIRKEPGFIQANVTQVSQPHGLVCSLPHDPDKFIPPYDPDQFIPSHDSDEEDALESWVDEKAQADLDEDELDALNAGTKMSTKLSEGWAIKRLQEWQLEHNIHIDLAVVSPGGLAKHLVKFYAEVRTKTGELLSPSSLRGMRAGLHRVIAGPPLNRPFNISEDPEFLYANCMLESMCKKFMSNPAAKIMHYPAIEEGDLVKLSKYFKDYTKYPDILQQAVWFCISYLYSRKGREGFRLLTKSSFIIKTDEVGREYLVMIENEKRGPGITKASDYSAVRAYGCDLGGENLNFVEIFKFYISKLDAKLDSLFQRPKYRPSEADDCWFQNCVVGKNKLGEMMKTISHNARLSRHYTNHSVRATAVTDMYEGRGDRKQIDKMSKWQKRHYSNVLSRRMAGSATETQSSKTEETVSNK